MEDPKAARAAAATATAAAAAAAATLGADSCSNARDEREGRAAIVVFARLPVPGRVKTRLAAGAGVGPDGACDFYRACALNAIGQAASCAPWADAFVYHSSADDTSDVASWLAGEGLELPCRPQLGRAPAGASAGASASACAAAPEPPDLGAKMLAAMMEAQRCTGGPGRKVLIIGTDIPDINSQLLRTAADALNEHEMVIGPSLDGGYYLLGLTRLEPRVFQDMMWSTERVLSDTLERATGAGLRVAPLTWLPRLRDVDTVQDLAEWVESQGAEGQATGPHRGRRQQKAATLLEHGPMQGPQDQAAEGLSATSLREFSLPRTSGGADAAGLAPDAEEALLQRQRNLLLVSRQVLERGFAATSVG